MAVSHRSSTSLRRESPRRAQVAQQQEQQHRVQRRPQRREQHVVELRAPRWRRRAASAPPGTAGTRRSGSSSARRFAGRHGLGRAAQRVEAIGRAAGAAAVGSAQLAAVLQLEDVDLRPVVLVGRLAGQRQAAMQPAVGQIDVVVVLRVLRAGARPRRRGRRPRTPGRRSRAPRHAAQKARSRAATAAGRMAGVFARAGPARLRLA